MAARVGIKQLAKGLGLTEGTVSRALNNYPDISPKTRQRVEEEAVRLGYRANPTARRLATGVAEAVAYILPETHSSLSDPFISQLLSGLSQSLSLRGWELIIVPSETPENETDMLNKLISSGRVSGVVISRPRKKDTRIELLEEAGFPFVVHGRSNNYENYAWYDVDSKSAIMDAVDHLVMLGHLRIGLVCAPTHYSFAQERYDGYFEALHRNGIPEEFALVEFAEMSDDAGAEAVTKMLAVDTPPTAFVCATDTQAIGALSAIRKMGLVPGKHISVIGYDGLKYGEHTNPPLTTFAQPQAPSGIKLADMLMAIIGGADPKDFQELHRAHLLRRMSDGPVWSEPEEKDVSLKREDLT